ncbi:uncharacterized protein LOC143256803 [Tachypleus tridentatus]|uniref:uncharacterized protein LOC143256803 n=1 Tax=Tachypleus tridentatus TaxID=6853 RepID=UPI003FD0DF4E
MFKAGKRKCTFNSELQKEYPFLKKPCRKEDRVKCLQCSFEFSVSHGGYLDIKDHLKSAKHATSLSVAAQSSRINVFLKKKLPEESDLLIAAKEATFAYHSAAHNVIFETADCYSKLIAKLFEPKFSSARRKNEAIILNVPLAAEELKRDLVEK